MRNAIMGNGGARRFFQRGFSLLEVLVAFTIMALVLGVFYQIGGNSIRNTAYLEQRAYAIVMAESLLARYASVPQGGIHESGGDADGFQWQLSSSDWERQPQAQIENNSDPWPFHQLMARVYWRDFGRTRSVVLKTLLPESPDE